MIEPGSTPAPSRPALAEVPVAILAGGRATRLGAATATLPKALLPVAGRPFIEHQLRLLHHRGLRRVVLCVGHLGRQIQDYVGNGGRFGMRVDYAFDGPQLMGTAGAIRQAAPLLGPLCWVLYGDSYLDFDYHAVLEEFLHRTEPALMTVYHNRGQWDRSNAIYRAGQVLAYDKRQPSAEMEYIDYGASLLRAQAIDAIPAGQPYDLADLFSRLAAAGQLAGHEVMQRFYEIGSPDGLRDTERYLRERSAAARGELG